ncbi:MAG TPA: lysozyme inhibitor LprI family protein [Methylocella sp.]|nr:lysozyme inhibitor LprI family protein [Methylocella sp.]
MPGRMTALLVAGLLISTPAMPFDPSQDMTVFSDQWRLTERVAAPWMGDTGQQDSLNTWLGHSIRFLHERIDARAPLGCLKPKYEFRQLAPRALFHGKLTDPEQQAPVLGFDEADIKEQKIWTLTTGCGVEFYFIDPYTVLFASDDNYVYKLVRDAPPGPRPKDAAEVEACLKLVADNDAARGSHEEDILTEKTGPAGRLASASAIAPVQSVSCIGVVANACIQKSGDSDGTRIECYERERAVWDARLNQAYKNLWAKSEPDVRASYQKVQRAWMAYRDARCNHPLIEFKGSMAGPLQAWCLFHLTADQALWLEGRP